MPLLPRWFAAIVYAFLIWTASVHLGWHYALDGVLAALLTVVLWWVTGLLKAPASAGKPVEGRPVGSTPNGITVDVTGAPAPVR